MRLSKPILILFLLIACSSAMGQAKYSDLKTWAGKYPTYNNSSVKFFKLSKIRRPLKKLLSAEDFYLLTKGHTKETPFKLVDHYLRVTVCGEPDSYACISNIIFVIDLNDGSMYVAVDIYSDKPKYYASSGAFTDLPEKVQNGF